jgi:hypothetical protein
MRVDASARWLLAQEARALVTRIARLRPYSLQMTMVPAAAIAPAAQLAIEAHMSRARQSLYGMVHRFLNWLERLEGRRAAPAEIQRRFTLLRLRFNAVIAQFDTFADVLVQRSEHETGVWIAGLDELAADALALPAFFRAPPVMCYVDRGHGAAIRRARTRLPGGDETPVAIIRVPRERMVGSGIASSLVHEVGHQAAALLDLVVSLRPLLRGMQQTPSAHQQAWQFWERWISEIVADFWSVGKLGITSTLGLLAVVSLPRAFVFGLDAEDPHPMPWLRVKLSCAMGQALFPHPQWQAMAKLWESLYPLAGLDADRQDFIGKMQATMPGFVTLLVNHRPKSLRGGSLAEAMQTKERMPARLAACYDAWGRKPSAMRAVAPTLAFAVIGQARADGRITPEQEASALANLLTYWAARGARGSASTALASSA